MMKVSWLHGKVGEAHAYQVSDRRWLCQHLFHYCLTVVTSFVRGHFATAATSSREGKRTSNMEGNLEK